MPVPQVGEAAKFFSRGINLLVSDVGNSSRLFMKAVFGALRSPCWSAAALVMIWTTWAPCECIVASSSCW